MKQSKLLKSIFLALLLSASALTATAYDFMVDGLAYNYNSDGTSVTVTFTEQWSSNNYSGLTTANIPSSVTYDGNTYSVTSIGDAAFCNCSGLASVTIPNSVTSIGSSAFSGCSGLTSVNIPNSVTSIGNSVFYNCTSLTSVTIPNSVTSIGNYAFYGCSGLTSVTIGNSVTSIDSGTFAYCSNMTSITIPNSVTFIDGYAFAGCNGLTSVHITDLAAWCNIVYEDIGSNPLLYAHHLYLNGNEVKDLVIPNSVTSIGNYAFIGCSGLTSISIPSSVTSIGNRAFERCSGTASIVVDNGNPFYDSRDNCNAIVRTTTNTLIVGCKNTIIPNSVTSIGDGAFFDCSGLTSVTIPNSVTSIGNQAFQSCSNLTIATIGNSVTSIGDQAFQGCSGLTSITIPNSVTSIYSSAFYGCSGLTSIIIPNSVTSIGGYAFRECSGLTNLTWNAINCPSNGNMTTSNIENVTIGDQVQVLPGGFVSGSKITSVTIPNSVTSIGSGAFANCIGLTSMVVENGNSTYDSRNNCNAIIETATNTLISGCKNTIIPNSVTSIGQSAFLGCSGLTSATIPNSVTSIGVTAFSGCSGLTSITSLIETPSSVSLGNNVFSNVNVQQCILFVPQGKVQDYRNADQWNAFRHITDTHDFSGFITFADSQVERICVDNWDVNGDGFLSYEEADLVTSINDDCFNNYNYNDDDNYITSFEELKYFHNLASIGNSAFEGCSGLTSITIPNSVTSIGNSAFYGCSGLTSITIPNAVTYIGSGAFYECHGLTGVLMIPDSVTYIGNSAFYECHGLTGELMIPDSVAYIGEQAFYGCGGLTNIVVGSGNPTYDSRNNCNAIIETATNTLIQGCTNTIIPNSVTSIGNKAFAGCSDLTSVTIPNSVTSIGNYVFAGCSGLESIVVDNGNTVFDSRNNCNAIIETETNKLISGCKATAIPNSVTSIGGSAFNGCSGLTSVTIPNSVTSIGSYAFEGCSGLTSISIPCSVSTVGTRAFGYCTGLTSVTWNAKNASVPSGYIRTRIAFYGSSNIKTFVFGNEVEVIPGWLCYGPRLSSILIPNSVNAIKNSAFILPVNCSLTLTLTGKGDWNYDSNNMVGLRSVINQFKAINVGSEITLLGNFGFNPDTVNCYAVEPPTCEESTFADYNGELHVPTSAAVAFMTADYWQNFTNMVNDLNQKVVLSETDATVGTGETLTLSATTIPTEDTIVWATSNSSVAIVNKEGVVTAVGWGECNIFASIESNRAVYASCHITVSNAPDVIIGDVNGDDDVNVMDITALIDIIMNDGTNPLADVNRDGDINVMDITALIDIIMNS